MSGIKAWLKGLDRKTGLRSKALPFVNRKVFFPIISRLSVRCSGSMPINKAIIRIYRCFNFLGIIPGAGRDFLELELLPHLREANYRNILIVGVMPYSQHYAYFLMRQGACVSTMDSDSKAAACGSPQMHIVDRIENAGSYFPDDSIDLVLCCGIYGFGLMDEKEVRASLSAVRRVLKPKGLLVFSWNRKPMHDPIDLANSGAFSGFRRCDVMGRQCADFGENIFEFFHPDK